MPVPSLAKHIQVGERLKFASNDISHENLDVFLMYMREFDQLPLLNKDEEKALGEKIQWRNKIPVQANIMKKWHGKDPSVKDLGVLFSKEDRLSLLAKEEEGKKAYDFLVKSNLKLVVSLAKKNISKGLSLLDLIQEGSIGLLRAAQKYDPSLNLKFSTYAVCWIKQALTRGLHDKGRTIRLPVHMGETLQRAKKVYAHLEQINGYSPSYQEVATKMGVSATKVENLFKLAESPISLNEIASSSDREVMDKIETLSTPDMSEEFVQNDARAEFLSKIRMCLTDKEYYMISLVYGLNGGPSMSYTDVGEVLGITRERVRQIINKALESLRAHVSMSDLLR